MGGFTRALAAGLIVVLSSRPCSGSPGVERDLVERLRAADAVDAVSRVFVDASAAGVEPGALARGLLATKAVGSADAILLYLGKHGTDQILSDFAVWTLGVPAASGVERTSPNWMIAAERTARALINGGRDWTLGSGDARVAAAKALTARWSSASDSAALVIGAVLVMADGSDSDALRAVDALADSDELRLQSVVERALSVGSQRSTYTIARALSTSSLIRGSWLEKQLSSQAEFGRLFALVVLREQSPAVVLQRDFLMPRLADSSEFVRAWVVEQLADTELESSARLEMLRAMARDASSLVRMNVIQSLVSLPRESLGETRSWVVSLADDGDEFVRLNVVYALERLPGKTPAEMYVLRKLSRDRRPSVRREAAFAVVGGGGDDSDAFTALIDACADGRWDARSPEDWDRLDVAQELRALQQRTRTALREFAIHVARDGGGSRLGALRVLACMGNRGKLDVEWLRALRATESELERDVVRYLLGE